MRKSTNSVISSIVLSCVIGFFSVYGSAVTAKELLREGYPQRYVVKEGDTLWDLSATYLNEPWRWKEVWKANTGIDNPDLIYPGDILVLSIVGGEPILRALQSEKLSTNGRETVKLKAKVRSVDYVKSIPPISPRAMKPFLVSPLITSVQEMQESAYIVEGVDNRLIGGRGEQMYAKGITNTEFSEFQIFRPGREFVHPTTMEKLGYEAIEVGRAKLVKSGNPAKLLITSTKGLGVLVGDFLREAESGSTLPFFFPAQNQDTSLSGVIISEANRNLEFGNLDVVAVAFDPKAKVNPGEVFKIMSKSYVKKDPIKEKEFVTIPAEQIGLLMIIRSFDRVSYGIITDVSRAINSGDLVMHPRN